jgi:hypothetical protein
MIAKLAVLAGTLVLAATTAGSAGATPPSVTQTAVDRTFTLPAGTACSFPLRVHNQGIRRVTTFYDEAGNVTRTMIVLIGYTQSYTNVDTGEMLSTPLAGPAVIEPNGDGTVTTTIPGNDGRLVVPGEGFIYGDLGLIEFIAPESSPFTVLDVLLIAGHWQEPSMYLEAVCASLD